MSELFDFYRQQAEESLSHIPWVAELQAKSWHELVSRGFPTRSNEDWKYTRVEELLKQRLPLAISPPSTKGLATISDCPSPLKVVLRNGEIQQDSIEQLAHALPLNAIVLPLSQALIAHENLIKPYFDKLLAHEHGFHYLNTTLFQTGIFIYLPVGTQLNNPIVISHHQEVDQSIQIRHLVILEESTNACVVEDYVSGDDDAIYFTNTITEISLGKHAQLAHYKVQRENKNAYHIGHISVAQSHGSQFENHSINLGGKLVRSDVTVNLIEERAKCLLNGIYIPGDSQHVDHHTVIHHHVPWCSSEQDYKGILGGHARAVFNGKVIVEKHAQGTKATQSNKNLLLSSDSEVDTKPQLEIFSDDISCSHGATVGQLDEEALFYLATRGIEPEEASRYLIHAFVTENLNLISNPNLTNWIKVLIDQQLEQLG